MLWRSNDVPGLDRAVVQNVELKCGIPFLTDSCGILILKHVCLDGANGHCGKHGDDMQIQIVVLHGSLFYIRNHYPHQSVTPTP